MNTLRATALMLRSLTARTILSAMLVVGAAVQPAILPVALTSIVVTQTACPKESLAKNGKRVNAVLKEVVPIFQANGISVTRLNEAIGISERLVSALGANDGTDTVKLTSDLIAVFNALVAEDVIKITSPQIRTIILVSLAVANIALREIADALAEEGETQPTARASREANVIQSFRAKPKWRCRDSASGQFRKMDYCKANPSTSTVETQ